jgi:ribonuclease PH
MRKDGRKDNEMRPVKIERNFLKYAEGSALIQIGDTKVICSASVLEEAPKFLKGSGKGWVTAEYSMLPRSTQVRSPREVSRGKPTGRTSEIQRLIGRALRAVTNNNSLGERTIWLDCDVIQADGGTRTASITAAFLALFDACLWLKNKELIKNFPIKNFVAAISVGILGKKAILDLNYNEDSQAEVDMNIVMTGSGKLIEIQGTAERDPFTEKDMSRLIILARKGIEELIEIQKNVIGEDIRFIKNNGNG